MSYISSVCYFFLICSYCYSPFIFLGPRPFTLFFTFTFYVTWRYNGNVTFFLYRGAFHNIPMCWIQLPKHHFFKLFLHTHTLQKQKRNPASCRCSLFPLVPRERRKTNTIFRYKYKKRFNLSSIFSLRLSFFYCLFCNAVRCIGCGYA